VWSPTSIVPSINAYIFMDLLRKWDEKIVILCSGGGTSLPPAPPLATPLMTRILFKKKFYYTKSTEDKYKFEVNDETKLQFDAKD